MPLVAKNESDAQFEIAPAGLHAAVCYKVVDLGLHKNDMYDKIQHKCLILWEIDSTISTGEYAGKRFVLSKKYTLSLNEKANLRADLVTWRGKEFTKEELEGFDIEVLEGINCQLNIMHKDKTKSAGQYAVITSVLPASKDQKLVPENTEVPKWVAEEQAKAIKVEDTPPPPTDGDQGKPDEEEESDDLPF